jgi:hypothetical protein
MGGQRVSLIVILASSNFARALLFASVLAVVVFGCTRPGSSKVDGSESGAPPEFRVVLLEGRLEESSSAANVSKVVASAKAFWPPPEDYWPEPAEVREHTTFWWVKFERKDRRMKNGQVLTDRSNPGLVNIKVDKANLACSIVPTP